MSAQKGRSTRGAPGNGTENPYPQRDPDAFEANGQPRQYRSEVILTYNDTSFFKADYDSLDETDNLTDGVIKFWIDYLSQLSLQHFPGRQPIAILDPDRASSIVLAYELGIHTNTPDTIDPYLDPSWMNASHIFMPINNSTDGYCLDSGSHWSLVVISTADNLALHYDSLQDQHGRRLFINNQRARDASNILGVRLKGTPYTFVDMESCPVQPCGSQDCGIYICIVLRHLLFGRLLQARTDQKVNMDLREYRVRARRARHTIRVLIHELICLGREKQRRLGVGLNVQPPQINLSEVKEARMEV